MNLDILSNKTYLLVELIDNFSKFIQIEMKILKEFKLEILFTIRYDKKL